MLLSGDQRAGASRLADFHDFLKVWSDLYRFERKVVAAEMNVSATHYWRIESGSTPLTAERLRALARLSQTSLNTLLLAFMLMDENLKQIDSEDPGDRLILWLHDQLAREARQNETDSIARHFLGRPQSLQAILDTLRRISIDKSAEGSATPRLRSALSG